MASDQFKHFEGRDALSHVAESQVDGKLCSSEEHGAEPPGMFAAFADSLRETVLCLFLIGILFFVMGIPHEVGHKGLIAFSLGWVFWKASRSSWLAWSRLERLHRVLEQEKYEIEHHRDQEREELVALYGAKGFQGKLLDEVVDVLMADGDRLLRVMVEEEMGYRLECYEHPLRMGVGAFLGALCATIFGTIAFAWGFYPFACASLALAGFGAFLIARSEKNRLVAAVLWVVGMVVVTASLVYFGFELLV